MIERLLGLNSIEPKYKLEIEADSNLMTLISNEKLLLRIHNTVRKIESVDQDLFDHALQIVLTRALFMSKVDDVSYGNFKLWELKGAKIVGAPKGSKKYRLIQELSVTLKAMTVNDLYRAYLEVRHD